GQGSPSASTRSSTDGCGTPGRRDGRVDEEYTRAMADEVITAVVTPFGADGSVDLDRFRAVLRHLVATGSDGVVVAGTTGEAPTLTDEERLSLYETARDRIGGTATALPGT